MRPSWRARRRLLSSVEACHLNPRRTAKAWLCSFCMDTFLPDVAESGNDWQQSAGDFMCSQCRRKRLSAQAFSKSQVKKALAQHKAGGELAARCLDCASGASEPAPEPEQNGVATASSAPPASRVASRGPGAAESLLCTACKAAKPPSEFSRKMLTKTAATRRCSECVAESQARDSAKRQSKQEAANVVGVKPKTGKEAAFLAAMEESAAQAEVVTGMSVKRGRGRGRCGTGGRGRGRGRRGGNPNSALRRGPTNALRK